ncbi:unnamed protein product [Ranitomeya imitator]|uniref:Fibronectin type-III domain-containing protein n=1 Tax=Ranitomeya imitator TaxID=111125 RepID=A0ABN9LGM0_9NEOB|nr:unnamed protein product [Ranitomeya imitator]
MAPHSSTARGTPSPKNRCHIKYQPLFLTMKYEVTIVASNAPPGEELAHQLRRVHHRAPYTLYDARQIPPPHNMMHPESPPTQYDAQQPPHTTDPPKEPVLMCRSNNYPASFYCSWHLPSPTNIPNYFNITVKCSYMAPHSSTARGTPFPKNRCHIKYSRLFSTMKYEVTIVASNALGKSSATISFDEFTIVKPDPPENVLAKPVHKNPRRLEVTWQTPSTWPDPESFPLKFFLRYRPLILDQWQHVSTKLHVCIYGSAHKGTKTDNSP